MKATLRFDLPEEQREFLHANNGWLYASALSDFQVAIRSLTKHTDGLDEKTLVRVVEAWRAATESIDWDDIL